MSRIGTFVETESNLVVSMVWEKEGVGRYMVSFGYEENVLELDSADGRTFWIYQKTTALKTIKSL